jgi:hypothetical protein
MRTIAIALSLLAIAVIRGGVALFIDPATGHVGQERLAQFGTNFGGVEAPLLALLTVVGLALTLML